MKISIIDFETTGLTKAPAAPLRVQPRAIEFACCAINERGETLTECVQLINPQQSLPPEITKITGITDEDLADAPPFKHAWPKMLTALSGTDLMVAHNVTFDADILSYELQRLGRDWPYWPPLVCTVELFEPLWGYRPRLVELYSAVLGKEYEQSHRALDDVRALKEILLHEKDLIATIARAHRAHIS